MAYEKTAANDEVLRAVEFKQKRFSWCEGVKGLFIAGLPEVDFVGGEVGKVFELVVVSDREVESHRQIDLRLIILKNNIFNLRKTLINNSQIPNK
jgi:hypothetical protein